MKYVSVLDSMLAFILKIIRLSFPAFKRVNFPQSKKFSAVKEFFIVVEIFHNQKHFSQSTWKFPKVKEIFCKQRPKRFSKSKNLRLIQY